MHNHSESDLGAVLDTRYLKLDALNDPITGDLLIQPTANSTSTFQVNQSGGTNVLTLDTTNGRVGIGTTSPGAKLHVSDTYDVYIGGSGLASGANVYTNNAPLYLGTSSNHHIKLYTNNQLQMAILNTGLVGIGTLAPLSKLGVVGNLAVGATYGTIAAPTSGAIIEGNVGIGTTNPLRILGIGGLVARNIGMERGTVANTAGFALTLNAGGATAAATDKAGGDLILTPGLSTGAGESGVQIKGVPAGGTGTADGTQTTAIQVLGNKIGMFASTPVVKQTGCAVPTDLATAITAITALRTALNNYGLTTVV